MDAQSSVICITGMVSTTTVASSASSSSEGIEKKRKPEENPVDIERFVIFKYEHIPSLIWVEC